ncbi:MAG: 6-phosphogluconolactonase [Nanoarchaeota archaeon]
MNNHFNVKVFNTVTELGNAAAETIMKQYEEDGKLVLGVPWGTTPVPVFDAIAELVKQRKIDLSKMQIVVMDEYLTETQSGYFYISKEVSYSGHYHLEKDLFSKLPGKQAMQLRLNTYFPKPEKPEEFDAFIKSLGGVNIFLVATGAHDGHVAMNGPGTDIETRTRIIRIPETVRQYNFEKMQDQFDNRIENVPRFGVSVGLRTILDSHALLFVAFGGSKAKIIETLFKSKGFDLQYPVTFLWAGADKTELYLDEEAAAKNKSVTS